MQEKKTISFLLLLMIFSPSLRADPLDKLAKKFPRMQSQQHWRIAKKGDTEFAVFAHVTFDNCENQRDRGKKFFGDAFQEKWVKADRKLEVCSLEIPLSELLSLPGYKGVLPTYRLSPKMNTPCLNQLELDLRESYLQFSATYPWVDEERFVVEYTKRPALESQFTEESCKELANKSLGMKIPTEYLLGKGKQSRVKAVIVINFAARSFNLYARSEARPSKKLDKQSGEQLKNDDKSPHQDQTKDIVELIRRGEKVWPKNLLEFDSGGDAQYYPGGDLNLFSRYNHSWFLQGKQFCSMVEDFLNAATIFKQYGIAHNDLKESNIFLLWDAKKQLYRLIVGDLGYSQMGFPQNFKFMGAASTMDPQRAQGCSVATGAEDYSQSNLWSFGVILYNLLQGKKNALLPHVEEAEYSSTNKDEKYKKFEDLSSKLISSFQSVENKDNYHHPFFRLKNINDGKLTFAHFIFALLIPTNEDRMNLDNAKLFFEFLKNDGQCEDEKIQEARKHLFAS